MNPLPLAFVRPEWLLFALPPLLLLWFYARLPDKQAGAPAIADHLREVLTVRRASARWIAPLPFALFMLTVAGIALSGPSWQRADTPLQRDDSVVILALDASAAMQDSSQGLSAWQRVLLKSRDLVAAMPPARVGIIAFAGSAHWVLPPTQDKALLAYTLTGLNSLKMPVDGKYWQRIQHPIETLGLKVSSVLLLSDQWPNDIDQTPWPLRPWLFDATTNPTGAVVASVDDSDIRAVLATLARDMTAAAEAGTQWRDDGYFLILPFALVYLIWFRRGWSMAWSVLLICQLGFYAPPSLAQEERAGVAEWFFSAEQRGRYYFEKGAYRTAAKAFEEPLWRGLSAYRAGDFEAAAQALSTVDTPYARLMYANALAQQDLLMRALAVYHSLDEQHPYADIVAHNIAAIEQRLAERQQLSESQQAGLDEVESQQIVEAQFMGDPALLSDSAMAEQLTGQDILEQQHLAERWMAHINTAVGDYLSALFAAQVSEAIDD